MTSLTVFLRATFFAALAAVAGGSLEQQQPASRSTTQPASKPASAPAMLKVGDPAPAFSLGDHTGKIWKLADLHGKRFVLWFYPKAQTSGCTVEACGFRDHFAEFEKLNITILGISFDEPEENAEFVKNQKLVFPLLCDTKHETALAYGAWAEGRQPYPSRKSFVIDADGKIEKIYSKVDPSVHAEELLKFFGEAKKNK